MWKRFLNNRVDFISFPTKSEIYIAICSKKNSLLPFHPVHFYKKHLRLEFFKDYMGLVPNVKIDVIAHPKKFFLGHVQILGMVPCY